jgi:dienelactone hydrolase
MFNPVNAPPSSTSIEIQANDTILRGILEIPPNAQSIIVFAHGAGSNGRSPRNRMVARSLLQRGFAVLLPDLTDEGGDSEPALTEGSAAVRQAAERLTALIDWLSENATTRHLRIGLFGGRSGAAAVMMAAALRPDRVHGVISRGGRPDLADSLLADVKAPTLMIVGSRDQAHIEHNRKASARMKGRPMLEVIQGATHLFREPGKLELVASMSYLWFQRTLAMCG